MVTGQIPDPASEGVAPARVAVLADSAMVAAWVVSLPCRPAPPLSGGTAVAVTADSLPALLGQFQAYRRTSVLSAATRSFPCAAGSSCLLRGAMSQSKRFHPQHKDSSPQPSAARSENRPQMFASFGRAAELQRGLVFVRTDRGYQVKVARASVGRAGGRAAAARGGHNDMYGEGS